jgi:hypothetical protein
MEKITTCDGQHHKFTKGYPCDKCQVTVAWELMMIDTFSNCWELWGKCTSCNHLQELECY